ncbi:MAG: hypothetical protein LWX55_01250 [Deltaproteobacteria bacterium]|jgi:hypothetical protein|nr:hypothetical protein [Deltaproteobacteria bacterium]MDL1976812.1 hypothetical protein [Deltaproteobacteria bacterium]
MAIDRSKTYAKTGMIASLLVAAGTAFFQDSRKAKCIHIASGVALIGFSYWHHSLYRKEPGRLKKGSIARMRKVEERT